MFVMLGSFRVFPKSRRKLSLFMVFAPLMAGMSKMDADGDLYAATAHCQFFCEAKARVEKKFHPKKDFFLCQGKKTFCPRNRKLTIIVVLALLIYRWHVK